MDELKKYESGEISKGETFYEKSRRLNGIPEDLRHAPVLKLQSHQGFYTDIKKFVDSFDKEIEGKRTAFIDLSKTPGNIVVERIADFIKNPDPDVPVNELLFNIGYFPPLKENGKADEPEYTFAIDPSNYKTQLPALESFLNKRLTISEPNQEIKQITEETRKEITRDSENASQ